MEDLDHVKELLRSLSKDLGDELAKNPFFLVTEADLQGYLYCRLLSRKEFKDPFLDSNKKANFRIHAEYPRYSVRKDELQFTGRYDLAILSDSNIGIFKNDNFDEKQVWLGFELKVHWDATNIRAILQAFQDDLPAFTCENGKIPSDFGVIFHVNIAKTKPSSENDLSLVRRRIKECQRRSPNPLFCIYLESYRGDLKPRRVTIARASSVALDT